jgi:Cu-Zn family superoxide dismutase
MTFAPHITFAAVLCFGTAIGCSDRVDDSDGADVGQHTPPPATAPVAPVPGDHPPVASTEPGTTSGTMPGTMPGTTSGMPPGTATGSAMGATVEIMPMPSGTTDDDTSNDVTGTIHLMPSGRGVMFSGTLNNLPAGLHGFHIHENGDCSNPGEHYAPTGKVHGDPASGTEHHLGDLGNVEANDSNQATVSIDAGGISLGGENSVIGRALVVHAGADDLESQPSGNSGDPIACGVVSVDSDTGMPAEDTPDTEASEAAG